MLSVLVGQLALLASPAPSLSVGGGAAVLFFFSASDEAPSSEDEDEDDEAHEEAPREAEDDDDEADLASDAPAEEAAINQAFGVWPPGEMPALPEESSAFDHLLCLVF